MASSAEIGEALPAIFADFFGKVGGVFYCFGGRWVASSFEIEAISVPPRFWLGVCGEYFVGPLVWVVLAGEISFGKS